MDIHTDGDVVQEIRIAAARELVWKAWTESERITAWFAPDANIQPVTGGAFELFFNPGNKDIMSTKGCRFLKVEAPDSLVFEWKGPDPFADVMNGTPLTSVEVILEENSGETLLKLRHTGWHSSPEWDEARGWHVEAWKQMLASLKSNIESGEGILCCG